MGADDVIRGIRPALVRALTAGAVLLTGRVKETLSVAAPRKRVTSRKGVRYYRATTPAVKGAPPRKLSGRLRASITYRVDADGLVARVGTGVVYARRHELGDHPFLVPTLAAHQREVAAAMEAALLAP